MNLLNLLGITPEEQAEFDRKEKRVLKLLMRFMINGKNGLIKTCLLFMLINGLMNLPYLKEGVSSFRTFRVIYKGN